MRVALIASGFVDYSLELAGALAVAGHATKVFADAAGLTLERAGAPTPPGVAVQPWSQASLPRRWGGAAAIAQEIRRWRPALVIAHEHAHPHLGWLMRAVARIAPLALIVHDPTPHPGRDALFAEARGGEIARQRRGASLLFTHGEQGAAVLGALTGREVHAFPHGPILRPATPPTPPPGERVLLLLGRMEAYKGLDTALEAMARLQARGVRARLQVCGDGPELQRLDRALATTPGVVVEAGRLPRSHLLAALAGCDLVLAPYRHASASGVAAAAFANARGVVASAVGGLTEMVRPGVNGLLTPPGDPDALAQAILAALSQARALGEGGARRAEGDLGWARAVEAIEAAAAQPGWRRAA